MTKVMETQPFDTCCFACLLEVVVDSAPVVAPAIGATEDILARSTYPPLLEHSPERIIDWDGPPPLTLCAHSLDNDLPEGQTDIAFAISKTEKFRCSESLPLLE